MLRRKLNNAAACARFYEAGATDAGERAHSMLEELEHAIEESAASQSD
jgi:hypothetical protein